MSAINIHYTDVYLTEYKKPFRFKDEIIRITIINHDVEKRIIVDGKEVQLFSKHIDQTKDDYYIVICDSREDVLLVKEAYKVPADIVAECKSLDPVVLLQGIAQRFGLMIRIGYQFNKFIFQEKVPLSSDDFNKLVDIINPQGHSYITSFYFSIEEHDGNHFADILYAFCIDRDAYTAWLFGRPIPDEEVLLDIAPQLKGHITFRDLITSTQTIDFQSNYSNIGVEKTGFLFRLSTKLYSLEVGFTKSHFYIIRNDNRLELRIEPILSSKGDIRCFAMWSPTQLRLLILDKSFAKFVAKTRDFNLRVIEVEKRTKVLNTPPTLPPTSLLIWARKQAIIPLKMYKSKENFYEEVASSLLSIADEVATLDLHNPFWNITYDGQRIVSRKPKHETDIHPTIHGLLYHIAIAKNFEIIPEYPIRGGRLDFLILGSLEDGNIASACVEFKQAHSSDLIDGLVKQLPAYIDAKGSSFGIYNVLYFKDKYFDEPKNHDEESLKVLLERKRDENLLDNIRVLIINLGHTTAPSKL